MFIDEIELQVEAGKGGDGAVSFRRERRLLKGGPDGGDGGRGGSVFVTGDASLRTLNHLAGLRSFPAQNGAPGGPAKKSGKAGADEEIRVPLGTQIAETSGALVGEIIVAGKTLLIARGGRGGRGNARFATPTLQAPRYAEKGKSGQIRDLRFTLKIIADVALVGPPNAGKSSLLAALSNSKPKIASYPFTTLAPQLGIVEYSAAEAFAVIEVPGLLEGAAAGKGLGHDFLRHVERARALAVVVDGAGPAPARDLTVVLRELSKFDRKLPPRVRLVIMNKADITETALVKPGLEEVGIAPVAVVSALTGEGISFLKKELSRIIKSDDNPGPK